MFHATPIILTLIFSSFNMILFLVLRHLISLGSFDGLDRNLASCQTFLPIFKKNVNLNLKELCIDCLFFV